MAPPSTSGKRLVIVRHGHRHKFPTKATDNGLSKKGKLQAEAVARHFEKTHAGEKALVLSSPKKRCIETVEPLARAAGTSVEISDLLEEQGGSRRESDKEFEARLKQFCRWWKNEAPELVVACSHGDWIPLMLQLLTGARAELKKGGWAEIVCDPDEKAPRLAWLYQDFDLEKP